MFGLSAATIIWLLVAIGAAIVEGLTVQLVAVWFTVGGAVTAVAASMGASPVQQLILFVTVSAALLLLTRPLVKKKLQVKKQPTNADSVVGQTGLVKETIENDLNAGRIQVMGLDWAARSSDGGEIPAGEKVRVLAIEGVKLIVERLSDTVSG